MFDFHTLAEFSRANCAGICAFLVPANILATLSTIILAFIGRSHQQIWTAAGIASIFAVVMVLHVYTWFMIDVVMLPTFILLSLAVTCLLTNLGVIIWHKYSLQLVYPEK
ncbi:MAG TPA: hypothetical protein VK184_27445 [Nostocaceae cyanobacterium]|nr:hypothetical protein [Nostocaceae cyanobacterium]